MTIPDRRRDAFPEAAPSVSVVARARRLLGRVFPRQSHFSLVTAALAAMLLVTLLADLIVGHPHFDRPAVVAWVVSYLVLSLLPLVCGERCPAWLGLLLVGYLTFWSAFSLTHTNHAHMEVNALLESPMVAVYLGWFFHSWLARFTLALHLLAVSLATLFRPESQHYPFSSDLALLYTLLVSWLCVEAAVLVRARADREARKDPLTGVLNRRGLVEFGCLLITRALRRGDALSLAVIDFDDFKSVNDTGGHAAGDDALRVVSASWVRGLPEESLVARTGGDEFVLILPETAGQAGARLERLRAEAEFPWTWGLAQLQPGETFDDLVGRADAELYERKRLRDA